MAQLMKKWLRGQIETELKDAISWQHDLANASISQPRIKVEPGRYRYDGTRLHIDLRFSDPNCPFVQFVEFVKREPPYSCRVADGAHVILARFSSQCETNFKSSTKREVSRIACGAFLQLRKVELCIDPTSAKYPVFLWIEDTTGISIASQQIQVGRRDDLNSIDTLTPLLRTLIEQIKQNPGWRFHDQTQASQQAHTSASQIPAMGKVTILPLDRTLSSQPQQAILMSQVPENGVRPRPYQRPEPVQAAIVDVDSDSVSSVRSARITTRRRRGGGQMYDRRVFHESAVDGRIFPEPDRVANRDYGHRTLITEEDDESDVGVVTHSNKDKERYDSSISSDMHSPSVRKTKIKSEPDRDRTRDQASPSDQLIIAEVHHSRSTQVLVDPGPVGAQSNEKSLDEHAVTSPYSQSRSQVSVNQPRTGARKEIDPDHGTEHSKKQTAPPEQTWHGIARMVRSLTIVPVDQKEVLQSKASQYPAIAGGRFPPGNVPIEVLQSVRRAFDSRERLDTSQLQEKIDAIQEREGGSDGGSMSPARSADAPLSDQAPSPTPSLPWSVSPEPQRRASLPPDSSTRSPAQIRPHHAKASKQNDIARSSQHIATVIGGRERIQASTNSTDGSDNDVDMETSVPHAFVMETVLTSSGRSQPPFAVATPDRFPQTGLHDSRSKASVEAPQMAVQGSRQPSTSKQDTDMFAKLEEHLNSQTESPNPNTPGPSSTRLDQRASAARDSVRSSGESSVTRIPCTYPSAKVSSAQSPRLVKSFEVGLISAQKQQPPLSSPIRLPKKPVRIPEDLECSPGQLPPGWERRYHQGVKYYVDHHTKRTTWYPPAARQSDSKKAVDIAQQDHHQRSGHHDPVSETMKIGAQLCSVTRGPPVSRITSISHTPSRHSRSQLSASLDSSISNTQGSSTVSHDPALDVVKQKSTFLDTVYGESGLYGLFSAAYPGFRASEKKFNSIIEYQVWPVRDELAPKFLDDFVFQYEKLYEPYLLERVGMQGSQMMPYLEFYQREAGSLLLPNKIITSRRLEEFMDAQLQAKSTDCVTSNTRKIDQQLPNIIGADHGPATRTPKLGAAYAARPSSQHPKAVDTNQSKRPADADPAHSERFKRRKTSNVAGNPGLADPATEDDHGLDHWYQPRGQRPHEKNDILQQYADAYCKLKSNNTRDDAASASRPRWEY